MLISSNSNAHSNGVDLCTRVGTLVIWSTVTKGREGVDDEYAEQGRL